MNREEIKARKPVGHVRRRRPFRNGIRIPAPIQPAPVFFPKGVIAEHGQKQVAEMKNKGEKEKKEMQALNIKLTTFLQNIRYLEAENKHLKNNLSAEKDFKCDKIKILYEDRLKELETLLKDKDVELAATKSKNESLEEEVEDLKEQLTQVKDEKDRVQAEIDGLHDEVAQRIAESETNRRRASELQKQVDDLKARNSIVVNQLSKLREELEMETSERLELSDCAAKLEDELSFNYDIHDAEVKELNAMISKLKKIPDFDETQKTEIGNIVADLSAQYEDKLRKATADMERRYAGQLQLEKAKAKPKEDFIDPRKRRDLGKISELETQIADMKRKITELEFQRDEAENGRESDAASYEDEIARLRREFEDVFKDFEELANAKNFTGMEVAAMLAQLKDVDSSESSKPVDGPQTEGESAPGPQTEGESAPGPQTKGESAPGHQTEGESAPGPQTEGESAPGPKTEGESAPGHQTKEKETMSRPTEDSVKILEVGPDGKYIQLEDHAKFPMGATNMKNWTLTQTLDNGKSHTHIFTNGNVFGASKIVKIWGSKHGAGQDGITSSEVTEWDTSKSTISLKDNENMEHDVLVK
ncbi:intermediate filament protein ifa-1-like isoform X1 [Octopus sinensis]|uniref:Intermediate filament protein ifa-1-like isoform X1 n=1 Tax=Octopus sinensis TaxID=2607531 RepID=A0A6P7TG54_9MOLL|nr:intermediate filament protein ifa-1-like isoform X1 [Octopus sinensis]